jgi:pyrimidine-specific ribonucleoside hydrolase
MLTPKRLGILLLTFALLGIAALPISAQSSEAPTPVIIDTDMASDDWMAILYILKNPAVSIKAITVTGTGLAYCDSGVQIALGLLALAEYSDVPVSCWTETPLAGENAFPAEWRVTMETAESLGLPEGDAAVEEDAVALFSSTLAASEEPMTVLALGPLTNVGAALDQNPALVDKIANIVIMGGAVDVEGSYVVDGNTTAEWNIYCDPTAAKLVFESGAPITLVGLDATNEAPMTMEFLDSFTAAAATPEAEFVAQAMAGNSESIESGGYFFWDPLAAAVLTNPELVTLETRGITLIDAPGDENGRTMPDNDGSEIQVATAPDAEAFKALFTATLNS